MRGLVVELPSRARGRVEGPLWPPSLDPFRLLLIALSGWMNQQQRDVIDYLQEENQCCANNLATDGFV
jgi:hypothetical protein